MKNNTFKRVLAGSLALLTVAAYVPANVGGILPDLSIVASAATVNDPAAGTVLDANDSYTFTNATTVTIEGKEYQNVTGFAIADGKVVLTATSGDPASVVIPLGQQVKVSEIDTTNKTMILAFEPINAQAGGILRIAEDSAFVEHVYEITTDAGKYVYNEVAGSTVYDLQEGKRYVIRTTAYFEGIGANSANFDVASKREKNLNDEDLAAGQYEYDILKVAKNETLNLETVKATLKKATGTDAFPETPVIKQNGTEIVVKNATDYVVAQGAPVEITATPGETHNNMMLKVDAGITKSQTKSNGALTLTFVPTSTPVTVSWAEYTPTLQLTNDNGTIKATDVGFNALITNETVGTYEFKYGKEDGGSFVAATVNAKGEYVADGDSEASVTFEQKKVTVGNKTYNYFVELADLDGATNTQHTLYEEKVDGKWIVIGYNGDAAVTTATKRAGTFRATTTFVASATSNNCTLTDANFKVVKEFVVTASQVTGTDNLKFEAPSDSNGTIAVIQPANGVYNVPWQNGDEITPELTLYPTAADKAANTNAYVPGINYYITGTPTASEPGTYTMTLVPKNKAFNDGEEITVTWQIVNTNNYVTAKKTPSGLSTMQSGNVTSVMDAKYESAREEAAKNAQHFTIGYRQASKESIVQKIVKSLDFVGSTDLKVVSYDEVQPTYAIATEEDCKGIVGVNSADYAKYIKATVDTANPVRTNVEDPSEKAGYYVAWVANALANDGKTSAMKKDNTQYNLGKLYPVYFQVTPTRVRIVPDVTEITYGDDVKISELYSVIDADTKEKIGVPWASGYAPKFSLTDKYSEKTVLEEGTSTKTLPAGEYVYAIKNNVQVLDTTNYDVKELVAEDQTEFTVAPRDLSEMEFGTVGVPVEAGAESVTLTKLALAEAANDIEANPVEFAYTYKQVTSSGTAYYVRTATADEITANTNIIEDASGNKYYNLGPVSAGITDAVKKNGIRVTTNDFNVSGGTSSAKATDLGKVLNVTVKGVGNFTGTKTVSWVVGGNVLSDEVLTYEAEFDAAKPRVMAKFDITKVDGEIAECGFYYNNNGKMNGLDADEAKAAFEEVDLSGANMNQKGSKKVGFSATALAKAQSGNGLLTAEIANSSVKKQVYIMPYVKYKNGNIAYGKVQNFNYYDMVLAAEGALEVTKTDFVGDGKTGTAGQTYVKVDVTRVDKKGYEVERYGIVYNNSDSWNNATQDTELKTANTWLNLDYESEKTVKVAEVPAKDLATKIGTNTYIANTTKKDVNATTGKVTKDYGYGAKSVYAKAFIKIKDAAGNEKVYYSHLSDVTYGGFTVDAATGVINDGIMKNASGNTTEAITDSKNKDQIVFYAITDAADDYEQDKNGVTVDSTDRNAHVTRMAASTGNKTFQVWWQDQKNNK